MSKAKRYLVRVWSMTTGKYRTIAESSLRSAIALVHGLVADWEIFDCFENVFIGANDETDKLSLFGLYTTSRFRHNYRAFYCKLSPSGFEMVAVKLNNLFTIAQ